MEAQSPPEAPRQTKRAGRTPFPRSRLIIGIVLVVAVAVGAIVALDRWRGPPDPGRLVYVGTTEGGGGDSVVLRDLGSGEFRAVAPWPAGARMPRLSPDGTRLMYLVAPADVYLLDLRNGSASVLARRALPLGWTYDADPVVLQRTPEGQVAVAVRGAQRSEIWRFEEGLSPAEPVWLGREAFAISLRRPDDPGPGDMAVVTLATDPPQVLHRIRGAVPLASSWDGRELLHARPAEEGGTLEIFYLRDGRRETIVEEAPFFEAAHPGPRGLVALWGGDMTPEVWVLSPATVELTRLAGLRTRGPVWSVDGSHLLYQDGTSVRARSLHETASTTVVGRVLMLVGTTPLR